MARTVTPLIVAILLAGCTTSVFYPEARQEADILSALVIPRLAEAPTFDGEVQPVEWSEALRVEGDLVFTSDPGLAGRHALTLWFGSTEDVFHVGLILTDIHRNPYSPPRETISDHIQLLFTEDGDALREPSDLVAGASAWGEATHIYDGYWDGQAWVEQQETAPGGYKGQPLGGRWVWSTIVDNSTLHAEFYVPRTSPLTEWDGFQRPDDEPFRLALRFARLTQAAVDHEAEYDDLSDTFPGPGESPEVARDPSTWLRLRFAS